MTSGGAERVFAI
jgi:hypothetical protein